MRKLFFLPSILPSILPKRLGLPGRNAVASGLAQQLASAATCEGDKLVADLGSSLAGLAEGRPRSDWSKLGSTPWRRRKGIPTAIFWSRRCSTRWLFCCRCWQWYRR